MAKELRTLGWDYLMFVLFIMFSVFAPLWKRLFGKKKQRSKADYVFATGGISIIAIMLSIARGTLGVRTILGYPSELFYRGSAMWEIIYGMVCAYPIVCFIFVPVYFNLGITSVYQYIDLRFKSRLVRCLASATYIVRQICSLGVTVYTPCVALATVIGVPYWVSITGMSTICIFFTITGGLKAAINADVIQTVTVIFVTLTVIVRGAMQSGGPKRVYEVNRDNGRLKFFTFTGDMTTRVDTTSALLGQLFVSLSQFGCQQNFMQRYVSLKSLKQVNRAMMSNIPIIFIFFSLSWISGMVIYSTYVDCDPYADGYLQKQDEILPFFVEDQLSFIPGFLGIFLATLFNGALCMMVSNLNSVATVCWEDFVSLLPQFKGLSDKQQLGIIKFITIVCGLVVMGAAFGVGMFTGVIESSLLAFSATSGPLLACFVLAMLVPFANWKGTSAGMVASCAFVLWIIGGSFTLDKTDKNATFLPTSTEGCTNDTFSAAIERPAGEVSWLMSHTPIDNGTVAMASMAEQKAASPLDSFYAISYMYYSLIGTFVAIGVGILVSWFTQDPKDAYDSKLLHPMVFRLCQRFGGINKPYFISESENVLNTVPNAGTNASAGSNINHAFDSHNEANIIIGSKAADKDKHQIEVIFTAPPSITATASPDTEAAADVKMLNMTNGGGLIIGANLSKLDSNPINEEDAKNGSYRTLNDRDIV